MRGYLSGMVQTGMGAALDEGFSGEFFGLLNEEYENSAAFKSVITNTFTAGMEYAAFGETDINLLNTRTFGTGGSAGLLQLSLSKNGAQLSLGGGGLDLGIGSFLSASKVGSIFRRNDKMDDAGFTAEQKVAGRVMGSSGINAADALFSPA